MPSYRPQYEQDDEPTRYDCRHIFDDGHRCGSPALKGDPFCYYHHRLRRKRRENAGGLAVYDEPGPFQLAALDDAFAIQQAIGEIAQRLAASTIDFRRAGLLLYALQTASTNLAKMPAPKRSTEPIEEIVLDPDHGELAEISEYGESAAPLPVRDPLRELAEDLRRKVAERDRRAAERKAEIAREKALADASPLLGTHPAEPAPAHSDTPESLPAPGEWRTSESPAPPACYGPSSWPMPTVEPALSQSDAEPRVRPLPPALLTREGTESYSAP